MKHISVNSNINQQFVTAQSCDGRVIPEAVNVTKTVILIMGYIRTLKIRTVIFKNDCKYFRQSSTCMA